MSDLMNAIIAAKLMGNGGGGGGGGLPFPNAKRYIAVFTYDAKTRAGEARVYRCVNGTAERTKLSYPIVTTTDYDTGKELPMIDSMTIDDGESLNDVESLEKDFLENYTYFQDYKFGQYPFAGDDVFHALESWFPIVINIC